MAISLVDTAVPMNDTGYPVARAKHIWFDDNVSLQDKLDNKELGGGDNSVTLTQEEFELLSDEEKFDGLYYTYDTKRIYKNGIQYGANEPIELTMAEFKALKEAGALDEKQEYIITTNENGVLLEASDIGYNGTASGLSSLSVQGAIDEVNGKIDNIIDDENVNENTVLSSEKTMEEINGIINDSTTNTTSTWSSSKIASEITSVFLTKDFSTGDNEKVFSFKVSKEYFNSYYAKRTFLLSANIYSLGFSKPVIGFVEIYRSATDTYAGYVVNLQDTRYTGVTVTVNGNYLEVDVSFNSYEGSGCIVSCTSLSNISIA